MKTKLTAEEQEILDSFEKGELVPVKNLSKRKAELMRYAKSKKIKTDSGQARMTDVEPCFKIERITKT